MLQKNFRESSFYTKGLPAIAALGCLAIAIKGFLMIALHEAEMSAMTDFDQIMVLLVTGITAYLFGAIMFSIFRGEGSENAV